VRWAERGHAEQTDGLATRLPASVG